MQIARRHGCLHYDGKSLRGRTVTVKVKHPDTQIITRSRTVGAAVSSFDEATENEVEQLALFDDPTAIDSTDSSTTTSGSVANSPSRKSGVGMSLLVIRSA